MNPPNTSRRIFLTATAAAAAGGFFALRHSVRNTTGGGAQGPGEGLFGYTANPAESRQFIQSLPQPLLRDAGPDLFRGGDDTRPVFLHRALYAAFKKKFGRDWIVGTQGIGDCVSWGWAHGVDVHSAVLYMLGLTSDWKPAATEAIYGGSRVEARGGRPGGYSDGSYGAAAAKFVRDWGVLFRQPYANAVDLTTYSAARAKDWGNFGCGGQNDGGRLDTIAKEHPVRQVALVTNFGDAAAAIRSGYPVPVCSGQGFTNQRDRDGFARAQGSWPHCMVFIGARFDPRPGLLCLNSWGPKWISGTKYPDDQPEGSFWVDASTVNRMLAGQDSFAVSGFVGFPFRKLNHGDWI